MHGLRNMWKTAATYTDLRTQEHGLSECQCFSIKLFFGRGNIFHMILVTRNRETGGTDMQQRPPAEIETLTVVTMQPCAVTTRLSMCYRIKFYKDE